jgi:hypothetical protein
MKPKYKLNDTVKFTLDGKQHLGNVYIIDADGTFDSPGVPSYDILAKEHLYISQINPEGRILYKHIPETLIDE